MTVLFLLWLLLTSSALFGQEVTLELPDRSGNPKLDSRIRSLTLPGRLRVVQITESSDTSSTAEDSIVVIVEPYRDEVSASIDSAELVTAGSRILAQSKRLIRIAVHKDSLDAVTRVQGVRFLRLPNKPSEEAVSEGVSLVDTESADRLAVPTDLAVP